MRELVELEVDQDVAAQQAVVKDEVHIKMVFIESETFLPRLEKKALAQFQQKMFEPDDDGGFQVVLGVFRFLIQPEKLQHVGLLQNVLRPRDDLAFTRQLTHGRLAAAQCQALIKAGGHLALQFGDGPAFRCGLDLVETAFAGIFDGEEQDIVGPTERERRFLRRLRDHNWTEFNSIRLLNFCRGQFNSSLLLNSKFVLDEEFPHELKVAH